MKEKLIVVGNGMAGIRTLEELIKKEPDKYEISVFGDEPHNNYNRILLSSLLAGDKGVDEIIINSDQWYAENRITLHRGTAVTAIDPEAQRVLSDDGQSHPYDRLILATGSSPAKPMIPGIDQQGVICFRTIADVERMLQAAKSGGKALVIGGGLLGLEAAEGLVKQGMDVTVVHLLDHLMETQLDGAAGRLLMGDLKARGIKFELNACTESILGDGQVSGIQLVDGRQLEADLIVLSVGIRPNTALAQSAGLDCERGIVVDDHMQTSDRRVYAVGECVQHRGQLFGLVAPLYEQAKVLAANLVIECSSTYRNSTTGTRLKVSGVDLFSAGQLSAGEQGDEITLNDPIKRTYKKLIIADNRLKGIILYGDTGESAWLYQLLKEQADIREYHEQLVYGQGYGGEAAGSEVERVAAMPDDAEICGCNGICKGEIVEAITEQGLTSFTEVRAHTKAAASCGSCAPLVEAVLSSTLGAEYDVAAKKKSMCECTSLTHEEVREAIQAQGVKTIPQLQTTLGWRTPDGCHHCRPALNFYLGVAWPGEYQDDGYSRHINERVHANIQKDGSYAVVPRIWGGFTNAAELKALGEVAEKYQTAVKITGGQRIALAGVAKESLPLIWKDLNDAGFVSGHAYGKALRSVKTCVGNVLCSYGIRDSLTLGIEIEKMGWGAWTPHKIKMGVSGCPRNCAEATVKDFGLVATEAGWEVYVGGNGGAKARVAQHLTRLHNAEEAKLFAAAFLQLYREEGRYKERTADWIERIGLDYIRERLVNDEAGRQSLVGRFIHAMECIQGDPWQAHVENSDQTEYQPIKLEDITAQLEESVQ